MEGNAEQTIEAWPRFTKSSAALGDYNWDYCGSSAAPGRDSVTMVKWEESLCQGWVKNHTERTGRRYGNNQSLLPGLSVLEWSCCVCVRLRWMVHYSSSCSFLFLLYMCHSLVIFCSPSPWLMSSTQTAEPRATCWELWRQHAGFRPESPPGGGWGDLNLKRGWPIETGICFETFCVRIMCGYEMYYIHCSFCS